MKQKIIIGLGIVVTVVLAALKLYSNQKTVEGKIYRQDPEKRVLVKTQLVEARSLGKELRYTGSFLPYREVMIVPQMRGEVTAVYFNEGDIVAKGKLLVQIDNELLRAQHIAAKASLETAQRNYDRYVKSAESEGVSKMQTENYWLQLKNAESQLLQLEKNIRLTSVTAPFAGTITLKDVEVGTNAGNGALARLTDVSQLKLELSVPESDIALVRKNDLVEIHSTLFPDKVFEGRMEYVADRADASHNYTVKVLVSNKQGQPLKAGMYGTATIRKSVSSNTLVIPRAALLGSAKRPQVFVIENSTALLKDIQVGKSNGLEIEVTSGLLANEAVITAGQINLANGTKVMVAK